MPSCVIEYTSGVNAITSPSVLVKAVHNAAISSSLFATPDIKTRAVHCQDYLIGEGNRECIHVTLSIMPGRSEVQKQTLSRDTLQALKDCLSGLATPGLSLTVQIKEIEKQVYSKHVF